MAEPLLERWTLTCFAFRWNLDVMLVNPAMRLQERKRLFNSKFRYVEHKSSSHINTRPIENSRGQTGHVIEINKDPDLGLELACRAEPLDIQCSSQTNLPKPATG